MSVCAVHVLFNRILICILNEENQLNENEKEIYVSMMTLRDISELCYVRRGLAKIKFS